MKTSAAAELLVFFVRSPHNVHYWPAANAGAPTHAYATKKIQVSCIPHAKSQERKMSCVLKQAWTQTTTRFKGSLVCAASSSAMLWQVGGRLGSYEQ